MSGYLKQKLSVTAFVEQDTDGGLLNGQATQDERPGSEAEVLPGRLSLQTYAFNGFELTEFLFRKSSEFRAPKYLVGSFKAGGGRRAVRR